MVDPDLENPRINLTSLEESNIWEELENCIKLNDENELHKIIKKHGLAAVWRPANNPRKETLLHMASEVGSIACMKRLIEVSVSNGFSVDSPNCEGETPLFCAIRTNQVEALKELLKANLHVNARNDQGHSVLHILAYAMASAKEKEKQDKILSCLDLILERPDVDLEAHNNTGYTPMFAAAKKILSDQGVKRSNNLISFLRKLWAMGASLEASDKKGVTVRQVLEERNALTGVLMGESRPSPQRPFISLLLDSLLMGGNGNEINKIINGKPKEETNRASNAYLGSKTVLFYVVDKSNVIAVEALLDAGADPWKEQLSKELCLHRCLSRGNPEILDLLINNMKKKRNVRQLDLTDQSFGLMENLLKSQTRNTNKNSSNDYLNCLKRIFETDILIDVNKMSEGGEVQSILHVAASFNNQEALRMLIEKGAYLGARKTLVGEDRGNILIALRTQTLEKAMDGCITHQASDDNKDDNIIENTLSPDYTLNLDYRFLVPSDNLESKNDPPRRNEVKTLMDISQTRLHRKAIKHPLIQTLLYAKWGKVLPLYLVNLLLYLGFVLFLTSFMYTLKDLRIMEAKAETSTNSTLLEEISYNKQNVYILMAFLIPLTIYMLIREIFQIIYTHRTYLKNFENYLEWFLILIVIILCTVSIGVQSTRHLAAWAMIIAWYEFVLLLGRAPPLSIYITMLRHVSWNFLKLIFLYGALILAFTVSFNIILQPVSEDSGTEFENFWSTLPKAIVMATGEFEYSDLSSNFFSTKIIFATSAVLVFLVFLFLIFLVLMNVMNGLAVTDTQQVMEEATLYSLKSRLELIYLIEEMLLVSPLCSFGFFGKLLQRIQIISSPKTPRLLVKVNHPDKSFRITYGQRNQEHSRLDNNTSHILRTHRLQILAEKEERNRVDPVSQCLSLLTELKLLTTDGQSSLSPATPTQ